MVIQQLFGFGDLAIANPHRTMVLPQGESNQIRNQMQLPRTAGAGAIVRAAGEAAYVQQQAQQMQRLSRYQLQQAQGLANLHATRARYQQGMAKVNERMAQTNLQHQIAAGNHQLSMREVDAQQRGFVAATEAANAELFG